MTSLLIVLVYIKNTLKIFFFFNYSLKDEWCSSICDYFSPLTQNFWAMFSGPRQTSHNQTTCVLQRDPLIYEQAP